MLNQTINFIGAGKLGKVLAKLICVHQLGTILGVCNSTLKSAEDAVNFIGAGYAYDDFAKLPLSDITFITVPDDKIKLVCDRLVELKKIKQGSLVVHCSGSRPSSILNSAKKLDCSIGSVHPIFSFAEAEQSVANFAGAFCALEGDLDALNTIQSIFNRLGTNTFFVDKDNKAIYHAATVFASNYVVTLENIAMNCLKEVDIDQEVALNIVLSLMQGAINNIKTTKSRKKSLTGPLSRGDVAIIQEHINCFKNEEVRNLYQQLGISTLSLTHHDKVLQKKIIDILNKSNYS